ncbi:hypothetical protein HXX76_002581 [Chlamydomonas incerta]|uniref:Phospholipid scramblase n=1 Tax=Chlamydomonas incerta TaxID=51695 RepID=A0A835W7P1_CHLIN|nr:hypothetical protein HXX76_002581 [Chlamydomonas incerta]|eukprot:KAG2442495.1 hypothetical protein HXX76_002581 [Chlamydomonas incerta]
MPHPLAPVPPATAGYAAAGYAAPPMPPGVAAATAASAATAATVAQQQYYALAQQQQQMLQEAAAQAALQAPVAPPAVLAAAYMTPQQQAAMGLNPGAMGYGAGATGYGAGMAGAAGYGAGMAGAAGYGAGMAGAAPAGAPPALQPGAAGAMQAPGQQAMTAAGGYAGNLEALPGVVIKETTQVLDAVVASIGGAYEAANKYHVRVLPSHVRPATEPNQPGTWAPSSKEVDMLPEVMFVQEDSSCCLRVCLAAFGSLNLRALQLHGYEGSIEALTVDRPCKMGAGCCCPLEMTITSKGQQIGMVIEDADSYCGMCYQQCCTCTYTQKVMMGSTRESLVHKYSLVTPLWCCGRVNNCCGATCCKPNLFIDVVSPDGKLVNAVQKTYGAGGAGDCCRSMFDFSNYILPFPPGSSHQERLALIVGVLSVEYAYFSRKGGEGNDDSN